MWPFCCSESFWSQAGQYRPVDVGREWQYTSFLLYLTCEGVEHKYSSAAFITKCCAISVDLLTWYCGNFLMFYSIWKLFILKKLANQNELFWLLHILCMTCTKCGSCVHPSFSLSMFHLQNYLTDFGMQAYSDHCHAHLFWTIPYS